MTSAQSIPSLAPLSHSPPSEIGFSSRWKRVRYDLTESVLVSIGISGVRDCLSTFGGHSMAVYDLAGFLQPRLAAPHLQDHQDADAYEHPRADDHRRPVVGRSGERAERLHQRVDQDGGRADGEDEVQHPVELAAPVEPVVNDHADVAHRVDEDNRQHQAEADHQDEERRRAQQPAADKGKPHGQQELKQDRDRRRFTLRVHSGYYPGNTPARAIPYHMRVATFWVARLAAMTEVNMAKSAMDQTGLPEFVGIFRVPGTRMSW